MMVLYIYTMQQPIHLFGSVLFGIQFVSFPLVAFSSNGFALMVLKRA